MKPSTQIKRKRKRGSVALETILVGAVMIATAVGVSMIFQGAVSDSAEVSNETITTTFDNTDDIPVIVDAP